MDLRTTRLRRMKTERLRGAEISNQERSAAQPTRVHATTSLHRAAPRRRTQQQPRPRCPPRPHPRSPTHILDSLEAAPPVTFATRSCDSSTLRSSSCFSSSSFFFPRRSRALILACGRRTARQPHPGPPGPFPAPRPRAAARPHPSAPTPRWRRARARYRGRGGRGPADGGGWRRRGPGALTMMAAPARSGRKRERAAPAEPTNGRGEEEGPRAATPPRGHGRPGRGGGGGRREAAALRYRRGRRHRGAAAVAPAEVRQSLPGSGGNVRAGRAGGTRSGPAVCAPPRPHRRVALPHTGRLPPNGGTAGRGAVRSDGPLRQSEDRVAAGPAGRPMGRGGGGARPAGTGVRRQPRSAQLEPRWPRRRWPLLGRRGW